jgi:hypothetical protein
MQIIKSDGHLHCKMPNMCDRKRSVIVGFQKIIDGKREEREHQTGVVVKSKVIKQLDTASPPINVPQYTHLMLSRINILAYVLDDFNSASLSFVNALENLPKRPASENYQYLGISVKFSVI